MRFLPILVLLIGVGVAVGLSCVYIVDERRQVLLLEFGRVKQVVNRAVPVEAVDIELRGPDGGGRLVDVPVPTLPTIGAKFHGLTVARLDAQTRGRFENAPAADGLLVLAIDANGGASDLDVQVNDVIVTIEQQAATEVARAVVDGSYAAPQNVDTISLGLRRGDDGQVRSVEVPIDETLGQGAKLLSLTAAPLTDALRAQYQTVEGVEGLVVTALDKGGPAAQIGIQIGDVITEIDGVDAADVEEALAVVADARSKLDTASLIGRDYAESNVEEIAGPGLYFKLPPPLNDVVEFEKRILALETPDLEVTPLDNRRLVVNAFARWRIIDPLLFREAVVVQSAGEQRLEEILTDGLREVLGKVNSDTILSADRASLMRQIRENSSPRARELGVDIVDVRIRRADLPQQNLQATYERMQAERQQEARDERARGREAAQILVAKAERQAIELESEARRQAEVIRGEADARRNRIFAEAYGKDEEFFAFYRSLRAYENALRGRNSSIVLSPDSEFFEYLDGDGAAGRSAN